MIKIVIEDASKLPQPKLSALVAFLFAMNDIPVKVVEQPDEDGPFVPEPIKYKGPEAFTPPPKVDNVVEQKMFLGLENAYDDVANGDQLIQQPSGAANAFDDVAKRAEQRQEDYFAKSFAGTPEQQQPAGNWPFTPPAQQAQPSGIEVDSQGLPWDARIHSSSRSLNADKSWRLRRNLDPNILTAVTAELRKTMGLKEVMSQVDAPNPPTAIPAVPPAPPVAVSPPPPPAPGFTPPVGAAPTASVGNKFPALMKGIVAMKTAGTLKDNQVVDTLAMFNIPSLPMLMHRPDVIDEVAQALGIAL